VTVLKEAVELAISPMDIHHKEFGTVRMGGYNKEEVDAFLDMVADELDRLLHRNQEQAELVEAMRQKATQFDSMQQTLQNALINAQKSADNIVQEASNQAASQMKEAQEQGAHMLEEARNESVRISQNFTGIRDQVFRYLATIRELLDKNQALVKDYETRLNAAELKEAAPAPIPIPKMTFQQPEAPPQPVIEYKEPAMQGPGMPLAEPSPKPPAEEPQSPAASPSPIPEFKIAPSHAAGPAIPPEPMTEPASRLEPEEAPGRIEETAPRLAPEPSRPSFSPEQEMELMRNSIEQESQPARAPEKPAGGEEGEKHFFWE